MTAETISRCHGLVFRGRELECDLRGLECVGKLDLWAQPGTIDAADDLSAGSRPWLWLDARLEPAASEHVANGFNSVGWLTFNVKM